MVAPQGIRHLHVPIRHLNEAEKTKGMLKLYTGLNHCNRQFDTLFHLSPDGNQIVVVLVEAERDDLVKTLEEIFAQEWNDYQMNKLNMIGAIHHGTAHPGYAEGRSGEADAPEASSVRLDS